MFTVLTRATSANLGPGFDCLGISLSIENRVSFTYKRKEAIINGKHDRKAAEGNLIVQSMYAACETLGVSKPSGFDLRIESRVPISRGLGSSACCISTGVALAYQHAGIKIDRDEIFKIACEIEGHPDNVAPCIYGGLVVSYMTDSGYKAHKLSVDRKFRFIAMIPKFRLATKSARGVLPASYSREDATFNVSHAALVVTALQKGNSALLSEAMKDRFHEPYRAKLIDGFDEARNIAMESGAAAVYLSGAGPTMMAIADNSETLYKIRAKLRRQLPGWEARQLKVSYEGIRITTAKN
ncbi:MAG: homoserine kinase [Eubacteriaceae bacterium]|jgi:homoserine kinase|nr:homoserine kinase [Eubacteriaceae bacterium]